MAMGGKTPEERLEAEADEAKKAAKSENKADKKAAAARAAEGTSNSAREK